jgi:SPP1 gp7 family putative phage head morphogenesis protein
VSDMQKRLRWLRGQILKVVVKEDGFNLKPGLTTNKRFDFPTDSAKLVAFNDWLNDQVNAGILTTDITGAPWTGQYVSSAYRQGALRSFTDVRKAELSKSLDFYNGSKEQFLQSAFGQPESLDKIRLLATRSFEELKGVTSAMSQQMNRILADGLAHGRGPLAIARDMNRAITKLGRTRANTIARTEVIRAHAEGQLDSFVKLGVDKVGVMAELSTAGDDLVCPICMPLEGIVLTIKEARGTIPRHPNCRCAFIPANVGEDAKKGRKIINPYTGETEWSGPQKRSVADVRWAIRESIKAERPGRSYADARRLSSWTGADLRLSKRAAGFVRAADVRTSAPAPALWNNQPTAVMRWMGKEGWSPEDAKRVLDDMGVDVKMSTVRTQLNAGKKGLRGAPANLTDDQAHILRAKRAGDKVEVVKPPPEVIPKHQRLKFRRSRRLRNKSCLRLRPSQYRPHLLNQLRRRPFHHLANTKQLPSLDGWAKRASSSRTQRRQWLSWESR